MRKCWWIAALLLVAGCAEQGSVAGYAQMAGVADLVRVGDLVFINSAGRSELRVLDTLPSIVENRDAADYVRAPNPLEYLSIPVLERPVSLHTDARFDGNGVELPGNYVFVRGSGASEISLVGAARDQLRELQLLPTGGLVTALAAHGGAQPSDPSVLFYAESAAGESRLMLLSVPAPASLGGWTPAPVELKDAAGNPLRFSAPDSSGQPVPSHVVAMVVMPRLVPGAPWELAVATRNAHDGSGDAFLLTLNDQGLAAGEPTRLEFGGPVRALFTHAAGRFPDVDGKPSTEDVIPAGARIFGILDEGACASPLVCGVVAVDAITADLPGPLPMTEKGKRSLDGSGLPMLPIRMGGALVQGLTIGSGMPIPIAGGIGWLELGGVVTASDGSIAIFNAASLQHIDLASGVRAGQLPGSMRLLKADGQEVYPDAATRAAQLAGLQLAVDGVLDPMLTRQEVGLSGETIKAATRGSNTIDLAKIRPDVQLDLARWVEVGDVVELFGNVGDAQRPDFRPCAAPVSVTAENGQVLTLSAPIPTEANAETKAACQYFTVRQPAGSTLKDGVMRRQETLSLTYQGLLPGMTRIAISEAGTGGVAERGSQVLRLGLELASRVRRDDTLQFFSGDAACASAPSVKVVDVDVLVDPTTAQGNATLDAAIPAGCTALAVRAGTEKPWVLAGSANGYLGRVAPGARTGPDVLPGEPLFRPAGFSPVAPAVNFLFRLPTDLVPEQGMVLSFVVTDGYSPFEFEALRALETATLDFELPGSPVYVKELGGAIPLAPRIYVAYSMANGLFEFNPAGRFTNGQPNLVYGAGYK